MTLTNHQAVGAYQRWKPPSFDEHESSAEAEPEQTAASPGTTATPAVDLEPEAPPEPAIHLPTAEEIEAMFEQARQEGHAEGLREGRAEGEKRALEEGRKQAERLKTLVDKMDAALEKINEEVGEELVVMAIELARQMIRHTLADHPAAIAETVREALSHLPHNEIEIHLHPDDAALVRTHLADTLEHGHHHLVEDENITRGGCKLSASGSELDATMETRWRRVLEGLGRPNAEWDSEDE